VIPAYNAEAFITTTLDAVQDWLAAQGISHEVLVVDDGSTDRTAALVATRDRGVQLLRNDGNRGKGYSVRRGLLASKMAWGLFMDVDHSTRIENLARLAEQAGSADVIIASRRVPGARIVRRQHRLRQRLGRTFPHLVRALVLPGIADTQCGFKLFRRRVIDAVFTRQTIDRFAFDVEVLLLARRLGHRIVEVPIDWDNPTVSTLRVGRDAWRMFTDLLRLSWRYRLRADDE
jgi:dolichyl-phosphate beta-glucosyltransferase